MFCFYGRFIFVVVIVLDRAYVALRWPETHYLGQVGLELNDPPASASKYKCHHSWLKHDFEQ